MWWPAVLILVVGALVLWCAWTATRLDRLHLQASAAEAALRETVVRRAAVTAEAALDPAWDPASSIALLDAAAAAQVVDPADWQPQSDLTSVIRLTGAAERDSAVERASREVALARRIHNDLAARAGDLHRRRRVRWLRLAGHAPVPGSIEFDA